MPHSPAVADPILDAIVRTIVERFHPLRIVLFGSHARGEATEDSDYDLMVLVENARCAELDAVIGEVLFELDFDVDAIVKSPEAYEEEREDIGLLAYAIDLEGKVLYARDGSPVEPVPREPRVREPARKPLRSVAMWSRRAENDFAAIGHELLARDPIYDAACFHAHACAEKYLKAVIVSAGRRPQRTHRLGKLLERCPVALHDDPDVRHACAVLLFLYRHSRYPEEREPTEQEAQSAAAAAVVVRNAARASLGTRT